MLLIKELKLFKISFHYSKYMIFYMQFLRESLRHTKDRKARNSALDVWPCKPFYVQEGG